MFRTLPSATSGIGIKLSLSPNVLTNSVSIVTFKLKVFDSICLRLSAKVCDIAIVSSKSSPCAVIATLALFPIEKSLL